MGLFDEITCEFPLPDTDVSADEVFQFKEFDPYMRRYKITRERLLVGVNL